MPRDASSSNMSCAQRMTRNATWVHMNNVGASDVMETILCKIHYSDWCAIGGARNRACLCRFKMLGKCSMMHFIKDVQFGLITNHCTLNVHPIPKPTFRKGIRTDPMSPPPLKPYRLDPLKTNYNGC